MKKKALKIVLIAAVFLVVFLVNIVLFYERVLSSDDASTLTVFAAVIWLAFYVAWKSWKKKWLKVSWMIAGVPTYIGFYQVLCIYDIGLLLFLAPVIWLGSYVAWKCLKKEWLKISWMIAGGTVISMVLWFILAVVLLSPGV